MKKNSLDKIYSETRHEHRFMLALIISELFLIAIFKLWPVAALPLNTPSEFIREQEIFTEEQIPTRQATKPAAPPKPQMPVPVPNDEVIEEEIDLPEFDDLVSDSKITENNSRGEMGESNQVVGKPQVLPTIVRIVEPEVRGIAKRENLKAEIYVTFLVGKDGKVEEAYIEEIRVYEGRDYRIVEQIGFGLMEATLEAASKWIFRPARNNGKPVRTYTTQVFSFGF